MKNFNDSVKKLLAFVPQFEQFQSKMNDYIKSNDEQVKKIALNEVKFESARRTFGDEIGVLKSHVDKQFKSIDDDKTKQAIENKKFSTLDKKIESLTKSIAAVNKELKAETKTDKDIKSLVESVEDLKSRFDKNPLNTEVEKLKTENKELKKLVQSLGDELQSFKKAFEE